MPRDEFAQGADLTPQPGSPNLFHPVAVHPTYSQLDPEIYERFTSAVNILVVITGSVSDFNIWEAAFSKQVLHFHSLNMTVTRFFMYPFPYQNFSSLFTG